MNKKLIGALLVSMAATVSMADHHGEKKAGAKADTKHEMADGVCQNATCGGHAEGPGFGYDGKGKNTCAGKGTLKATSKAACTEGGKGTWIEKKS